MSVFGLPSHQRLDLADMSPMKELRRQLAATAVPLSKPSFDPSSCAISSVKAITAVSTSKDVAAVVVATVIAPAATAATTTAPATTTVIAAAVVAAADSQATTTVVAAAAEANGPKRKRTAVDASLSSCEEDSRKKMDIRPEKVRYTAPGPFSFDTGIFCSNIYYGSIGPKNSHSLSGSWPKSYDEIDATKQNFK